MRLSQFSIGQSGLTAADATLAVTASNVANLNTSNYQPARAELSDAEDGGVKVSISPEARALQQGNGIDLVKETTTRIGAALAYRANLKTIQAADDLAGVAVHLVKSQGDGDGEH